MREAETETEKKEKPARKQAVSLRDRKGRRRREVETQ